MHVNDLLRLNGQSFVEAAYSTILKRQVDPTGLAHFTDRLALGHSKQSVIVALATSTEAQGSRIDLAGLNVLIRRRQGSYWHRFLGFFAEFRAMRQQLARIEYMLGEQRRLLSDVAAYRGVSAGFSGESERPHARDAMQLAPTESSVGGDPLQRTLVSIQHTLANTSHDADLLVSNLKNTIRSSALFFTMDQSK